MPTGHEGLPCPAGLRALLQLHLGHCCPVHLVRAVSKAQGSGPGKELCQRVVTAQACCSEGLRRGGSPCELVSEGLLRMAMTATRTVPYDMGYE